jgi:uncharacterized FlaG/YvyC family protein
MGGAGIFPIFPNKIPEISRIPATPTDDYEKKNEKKTNLLTKKMEKLIDSIPSNFRFSLIQIG